MLRTTLLILIAFPFVCFAQNNDLPSDPNLSAGQTLNGFSAAINSLQYSIEKEALMGLDLRELEELGYITEPSFDTHNPPLMSNSRADCTDPYIPFDPGTYTAVPRNDDGSLYIPSIGFDFSFCGTTWTDLYINTNGNLTFGQPVGIFSPSGFPYNVPMVAPFWADVDTRNTSCGQAWYRQFPNYMIVTWEDVGWYNQNCSPLNTFQVIISDGTAPIIGVGNNIQFRYGDMNWTTGQASGGGPFGGTPATVGYNSGDNVNYEQIGRFNVDGSNYDGPFGTNDGVHWLDFNCFVFDSGVATIELSCMDITKSLDANCSASITVDEVSVATSGCSTVSSSLDISTFGCADAGANTVTVTATNGTQTVTCTAIVTITTENCPVSTIDPLGPLCENDPPATLNATPPGGTWGGATTDGTFDPGVLGPGIHNVTYSNPNGCPPMVDINIEVYPSPTVTVGPDPAEFCEEIGFVELTANGSGGTGTLTYSWTTPIGPNSGSLILATDPGDYTVTVTDLNGCSSETSLQVIMNLTPTPSIDDPGEICESEAVVFLTASPVGGVWSGAANSLGEVYPGNLGAGIHTVFYDFTDGFGCTGFDQIDITIVEEPEAIAFNGGPYCEGDFIELFGNTNLQGPVTYVWSGPGGYTSNEQNPLDAFLPGTYTLEVIAGSCTSLPQFTEVIINPIPDAEALNGGPYCEGELIELFAGTSSNASFIEFAWSGPGGYTSNEQFPLDATLAGVYIVIITGDGCPSEPAFTVVELLPQPFSTPTNSGPYCTGDIIELFANPGPGSFITYSWTGPGGYVSSEENPIDATLPGNYILVMNVDGCISEQGVTLVELSQITPPIITGDELFCEGTFSFLDAGPGYSTYQWSNGDFSQTTTALTSGTYSVTVSNVAGCTEETSFYVEEIPNPIAEILGSNTYCAGTSTTLIAQPDGLSYLWSTGSNAQSIDVSFPDIYFLTVTDANGCSGEVLIDVIETPELTPVITGNQLLCEGGPGIELDAGPGYLTYLWSDGTDTQWVPVDFPGNYSVTVSDGFGCTGETQVDVLAAPIPTVSISGNTSLCNGETTFLDADPGFVTYIWSDGSSDPYLFVDTDGAYGVTVTDANGCTAENEVVVEVLPLPEPIITGPLTFCTGTPTTIDAGGPFTTYIWSDGSTTQTISVGVGGAYSVTVTDANGCTGENEVLVEENAILEPVIDGVLDFCENGNTLLDAGPGYTTYLWNDGTSDPTLMVDAAGSYSVTVTDDNGCTGETSVDVIENPLPTVSITGDAEICEGENSVLDAGGAYSSYTWSDGSTTQTIDVSATGTYSVTVTDVNNCTNEASFNVTSTPLPEPVITGQLSFCTGDEVTLDAGGPYTIYLWSDGSSGQTLNVNSGAAYGVTVTDANGCTGEYEVTVTENPSLEPVIEGELEFCENDFTILDAGSGYLTYIWSDGTSTQTLNTDVPGSYSVTVSDATGCTGETEVTIIQNSLPIVAIAGDTEFCENENTMLDAGGPFNTYVWSDGSTSQTITVATTGTYSVTVTNAAGCENETAVNVNVNTLPEPAITGPDEFCEGSSISLDAGGVYNSYSWSEGSTSQTIDVSEGNTYSVTVTDANGCTGETQFTVTENPELEPEITGVLDFCEGENTTLDAGAYTTYIWSDGSTSQSIEVDETGSYSVTVSDDNGCTGETSVAVAVNDLPVVAIDGETDFCEGEDVTLDAGGPYNNYEWSDGTSGQTITVTASGTYSVIVTDGNGCTNEAALNVVANPNPVPVIAGSTTFCSGSSATLDAGSGYTDYLWSDGSDSQTISVSVGDTYMVTVTDTNGCTAIAETTVTESSSLNPVISGGLEFCAGTNTTLDAGAGFDTYTWSDGTGDQTLTVNAAGDYSVTVTDLAGCTGETTVTVEANDIPTIDITGNLPFCEGENISLDAGDGFETYVWSDNSLNQTIDVSTDGTFGVTVTDANGCTNEAAVDVVMNALPVPTITGADAFCTGSAVELDAGTYETYLWSDGSTTQMISVAEGGTYTVTVTNTNGCTGETQLTVTENQSLEPEISGLLEFCAGENVELTATAGFDYEWSTGATTQSITVDEPGIYEVVATDANGCTGITEVEVQENALPDPQIAGSTTFCIGTSTILDAGAGYDTYLWSDGSLNQTLEVTSEGNYTVVVTTASGCTGEAAIDVTQSSSLSPVIVGDLDLCEGENSILDAGTGFETYTWSNGAGTQTIDIDIPGLYSVTVSDASGCTGETTATLIVNPNPGTTISGINTFCEGDTPTLDAGAGFATYLWSDGSTTQTILATATDTYSVTVTDANNCSTEASIDVVQNPNPLVEILGPNSFCSGNTAVLSLNEVYDSYQWSNGETTDAITLDTGGTLTVTVVDANGCTGEASVTVTENSSLSPQITGAFEMCDGFTTILDAGSGFETYTWTTGETSQTITVSAAGDYGVVVTDVDGCSGSTEVDVTLIQNPEPIIAGSTTFCSGSATTLDAGNYESYIWSDGSTTQTITTSTPGEYMVTVITADGCVGEASVMVEESSSLNPVISGPDSFCEDGNTVLDAGAGFETYTWSDGTTGQTLMVDLPGNYSVTVSDASGCTGETVLTVTEVIPPVADLMPGATLCNTAVAGSVINLYDLILSGDMTGDWDDVDGSGAVGTFDNLDFQLLTPGNYTFEYTTNSAVSPCVDVTYSVIITLQDCACPGVSFFSPDPICNSDGLIDLTTVANTLEPGVWTVLTVPAGSNPATLTGDLFDATGADAGEYILQFELLNPQPVGCPDIFTQSIIVDQEVTAGVANAATEYCADDSQLVALNGELSGADIGGVWVETSGTPSQGAAFDPVTGTFNTQGQDAGVYTFEYEVTGALVCPGDVETVTVQINELPIVVAGTGVELDCSNPVLSLNASGSSSGPDFEIVWTGPGVVIDGNENTLSPNIEAAGIYELLITNMLTGCSTTDTVEVTESADVPIALAGIDQEITCVVDEVTLQPGENYGTDYLIEWSGPGITPANMNDLNPVVDIPGVYSLTITYIPTGCASSPDQVEVIENTDDPVVITDVPLTGLDCNITAIDLIGGSPNTNVTFEWSDADGVVLGTTAIVNGVNEEGIYYLTVTDTLTGCVGVETVTIVDNTSFPIADAGLPQLLDCDNTVVSLDGSSSQSGPGIIYSWSGPGIVGANNETTLNVDQPGVYTIVVEDTNNGCSSEATVTVQQDITAPTVSIETPEQLDCMIEEVSLDGSASSSGSNYNYQWQDAAGNDLGASEIIVVGNVGTYVLYIEDSNNGCSNSATIEVTQDENVPQAASIEVRDPDCFGDESGIIMINEIEGGTAPYLFSFDGADYSGSTFFADLPAGNYPIALEDANGCEWDTMIVVTDPPALELDLGLDLELEWGDSTTIVADINIPLSQIDTIVWTPADQLECLDPNCVEVGLKPNYSYGVSATMIDVNGCEIRDELVVFLGKERKIYIPNAFSPNGDFVNDVFMVFGDDPTVERINFMRVFNRWGEIVYDLSNLQPNVEEDGWDGTFHGEELNPAVFVYIIEVEFIDGHVELYKGDVTLMK